MKAVLMKVALIFGTRPEIVKMSPVIRHCEVLGLDYSIIHTGQHYAYYMDRVFFEELKLPNPTHHLGVGSGLHGQQTGEMLRKIEKALSKDRPDIVLVQGDTNSTLAGALSASKLKIDVGHIEAGLRSYDRKMPEEINRVLTDHCSDLLFAPTRKSERILRSEGIPEEKIFVTGNTIVDVICHYKEITKKCHLMDELNLHPKKYFLATIHRQENVDNMKRFAGILEGLKKVSDEFGIPLIYVIHPRSKKRMKEFGLVPKGITIVNPVGFITFLQLEINAKLVLTDSGGIQEETCVLKIPCVTLRDNTERPETIEVGSNVLAGTNAIDILVCARKMLKKRRNWQNPFGEGDAGKKIVEALVKTYAHH